MNPASPTAIPSKPVSNVNRREFLVRGVALGIGAPLAAAAAPLAERRRDRALDREAPAPPSGEMSWIEVRKQFDLDPAVIHMSGFFLVSHPRPVREALEEHRRGLDRDPLRYVEQNIRKREVATREAAAAYLGAPAGEIAMTDSTTMGLGLVYTGLRLRAGQEILTDTHDHHSTTQALEFAAARTGASVRRVALYGAPSEATAERIVETVAKNLRPATRVVALTWVHSGTGVKLPMRRIADAVAAANAGRAPADRALLVIDGVHGFGLEDVTVADLGCDVLVAGCHKWLFGPRGTGLVWANASAWSAVAPTIPSFDPMWRDDDPSRPPASLQTPGGFHSFEHRWALSEAFQFHLALGKARVAARIHALNRRCKEALAALPKVKVHTPKSEELSAGIICFEVEGVAPREVVARLAKRGVAASTTPPFYEPTYARVAPSLLTSEDDVDATVRAIAEL